MNQVDVLAFFLQMLASYIFVSVLTDNARKQTVTDLKTDLRTTKEDLMAELKDSRENLLRESEISTKAIIDIVTSEVQKESKGEISNKEIMDIIQRNMEQQIEMIVRKHGEE